MASGEENLPVPKMSRERKIRPAIINGWLDKPIPGSLEAGEKICRERELGIEDWRFEIEEAKVRYGPAALGFVGRDPRGVELAENLAEHFETRNFDAGSLGLAQGFQKEAVQL